MDILKRLQEELNIKTFQVENTVTLLDEGNTVPFIARYRKEMTGSLDDQVIRVLADRLAALRNLEEKREQVRSSIAEQGMLSEELEKKLDRAMTQTEIDDIYRPFRPKRRTRASIAKEKGLSPLAEMIWGQVLLTPLAEYATLFVDEENGVASVGEALEGAKDILAEQLSDDANIRQLLREEWLKNSLLLAQKTKDEPSVYEMYYDYSEPLKTIVGHRILAINRGEKEGFLSVKIQGEDERLFEKMGRAIIKKNSHTAEILQEVIEDSYKRLIAPSLERELRNDFTEKAEESALGVFRENLKQLLLQPPIAGKVVLALDPAFRTGCKLAVIDETGKPLETAVIYPTPPQNKRAEAEKTLKRLIESYGVELISIGNGTASRESEQFVAEVLKSLDRRVQYIIANEAGASVYSASKLGAEEFPQYDVSLRSAVSIGRRIQDPLAELVKIDPKSIGVGQYQHDMNQKRLGEALGGVVEDCVNSVGVDLNTASPSLLSYVAGINSTVAKNILLYREENGKFKSRKELLKVPKLGPKAFLQCAGFLRIPESTMALDHTGVHPESYSAAEKLLQACGYTLEDVAKKQVKGLDKKITSPEKIAETLGIGVPTLQDIIKELEKPGRDPREDAPAPILRSDVLSMEDLQEGMVLTGTVRNVIDFGVFVDIGVHQDGLVHISQICNRFIKHPLEAVKLGDAVKVKVLSVDIEKKRISLTMKNVE
ncbi:30S ribosomal protein S1 [Anaerotignum neopropionicum]|uniref:30S ribosomal protein S1 n=1 Tax=Anaerotignum neopropionicum TaxID=36847 RepID=A0A136WIB9_9FIRM|nr:Tex family protein [Anaerotignum neopropionicum]KXL54099.1 30S ribosomal protein S1 [Anaerotignum neopropionicum]